MSDDLDRTFDVFLSHSHIDSEYTEDLAEMLEDKAGLSVWLDKWILVPGEHWQQEMARGLEGASSCAVCIGSETPSGWFTEEIERALNRQAKDKSFRVIPVLLPNSQKVNVDNFLELRTWVDFENDIQNAYAFHILISGIRGVAPGRFKERNDADSLHKQVRNNLLKIRELRDEHLIDVEIAQEYQRRLIDKLTNT
ncbi:MAG: toll/interleukin-1 receptor domain-containing protein [Epsilonproteobacteria bacterium]|nr:toll/interleukin-1 receptor domain-containing protein [Campylobacterota bacterium]